MSKKLSKKGIAAICALPLLAGLIGFVPLFSMVKPTPPGPGPEPEPESGDVKIKEKEKEAPTGEISGNYEAKFEQEALPDYNDKGERSATVYIVNKEGQQYNVQFAGQPLTNDESFGLDVNVNNDSCNIPVEFIDDVTSSNVKITSYFDLVFEYKINKTETKKFIRNLTLTFTPIPQDVVYVPFKTDEQMNTFWKIDTTTYSKPTILGLTEDGITFVETNNCNTLIIPPNYYIGGCNGLPDKIKTVYISKPDAVVPYFVQKSFCDCNGLEKVVFPSFENSAQLKNTDWGNIDFNYYSFKSKNLKILDVSRWNRETIENISYYRGDFIGNLSEINPEGSIPTLILPKETGNKVDDDFIKAGIYKIFKGSYLRDDTFANSGIEMTLAKEGPFLTASLGDNKILIGLNDDYERLEGDATWLIPKDTTDILPCVFYDNELPYAIKTIDFSQTKHIHSLGYMSFYYTYVPEIINLPIIDAAYCSFYSSYIRKITFQQDLNITKIPYCCFYYSNYINDIEFPKTIKKIDDYACYYMGYYIPYYYSYGECGAYITLPEGLISIGEYGFYYAGICHINIPTTLKEIGDYGLYCGSDVVYDFTHFDKFDTIEDGWKSNYPFGSSDDAMVLINNDLTVESINNFKEYINDYTYVYTSSVYRVVTVGANDFEYYDLGDGEVEITGVNFTVEDDAMYNFVIPATVEIDGETYKVVRIGDYAFKKFYQINKLDLTKATNLRDIYEEAFYQAGIYEPLELPNSIEYVDYSAFEETHIPSIVLNASKDNGCVYYYYCFYECYNLRKVSISPECGEISLYEESFAYDVGLADFELSKKITYMEEDIFYECSIIYNLTFTGFEDDDDIPSDWDDYALYESDLGKLTDMCWVSVPKETPNFAKKVQSWASDFAWDDCEINLF